MAAQMKEAVERSWPLRFAQGDSLLPLPPYRRFIYRRFIYRRSIYRRFIYRRSIYRRSIYRRITYRPSARLPGIIIALTLHPCPTDATQPPMVRRPA